MSFERQHAEAAAERWLARCTPSQGEQLCTLADLIAQERAGLLARAEAAEEKLSRSCDGTFLCGGTCPICSTFDKPLVDDLRAKLAAAEVRVGELELGDLGVARTNTAFWRSKAEKSEAAAGQMRCALKCYVGVGRDAEAAQFMMEGGCNGSPFSMAVRALATDAGHGYMSPEQVAKACAAARNAALEEAEKVTNGGLLDNDDTVSKVLRLACKRIHALKAGTP